MPLKFLSAAVLVILLAGCWNGENIHVRMGDVSIGKQLIDLQAALDTGAMSTEEYENTKQLLLSLGEMCAASDEDED